MILIFIFLILGCQQNCLEQSLKMPKESTHTYSSEHLFKINSDQGMESFLEMICFSEMSVELKNQVAQDLFTEQGILSISKLSKEVRNKFLECFKGIDLIKIILDQFSSGNDQDNLEDNFIKILSLIDFVLLSGPVLYDDSLEEIIKLNIKRVLEQVLQFDNSDISAYFFRIILEASWKGFLQDILLSSEDKDIVKAIKILISNDIKNSDNLVINLLKEKDLEKDIEFFKNFASFPIVKVAIEAFRIPQIDSLDYFFSPNVLFSSIVRGINFEFFDLYHMDKDKLYLNLKFVASFINAEFLLTEVIYFRGKRRYLHNLIAEMDKDTAIEFIKRVTRSIPSELENVFCVVNEGEKSFLESILYENNAEGFLKLLNELKILELDLSKIYPKGSDFLCTLAIFYLSLDKHDKELVDTKFKELLKSIAMIKDLKIGVALNKIQKEGTKFKSHGDVRNLINFLTKELQQNSRDFSEERWGFRNDTLLNKDV